MQLVSTLVLLSTIAVQLLFLNQGRADNEIAAIENTLKSAGLSPKNTEVKYNKFNNDINKIVDPGESIADALTSHSTSYYSVSFQQCGFDFNCLAEITTQKANLGKTVDIVNCKVKSSDENMWGKIASQTFSSSRIRAPKQTSAETAK